MLVFLLGLGWLRLDSNWVHGSRVQWGLGLHGSLGRDWLRVHLGRLRRALNNSSCMA
jgi:hypothetical protein